MSSQLMSNNPPKYAERLLVSFLREELAEEVLGDLEEKFYTTLEKKSLFKAKLNYWFQVVNYLRPFALKTPIFHPFINMHMFRHNFLISYRTLIRNKGYSLLNIGGLAIGMAVALLIGLWVWDELSYNTYHQNYDRIAQVMRSKDWREQRLTSTYHVSALRNLLESSYKNQFEHVVMMRQTEEHILSVEGESFIQLGNFMYPEGIEMLTLDMVSGNRKGLEELNTIMLSKTLANKLFDEVDPINKIVTIDGKLGLTVTGVYEDLPRNSKFWETAFIAPLETYFSLTGQSPNVWDNYNMKIYVQLKPNIDVDEASILIKDAMSAHLDEESLASSPELFLNPMSQWHLHSEFENGIKVTSGRLKQVGLYGIIGLFVLILACINFMNLSTARSEKRAKEIGIRKTIGSLRYQLIAQFLSESILVAGIAFAMAVVIVRLTLPWFNEITGKEIIISFDHIQFWVVGIGFTLLTGFLAGSYPALYLSSFNPVKSLKGTMRVNRYADLPRKILVVFQFTVSITLIIGTLIVYQQIQHARNRPIGYSQNGLLMVPKRTYDMYGKYDILREELKKTGAVMEIAEAAYPLTNTLGQNDDFEWQGKDPELNPTFNTVKVNYEYGKTLMWEVLNGRDFSRDMPTDREGVIITESAQKIMGLENPVGMNLHSERGFGGRSDYVILGVVKDLIKESPFQAPFPAIMFLSEAELSWMFIRFNPQMSASEALPKIERVFEELIPSAPFDYRFVDEEYAAKFRAEERIGKLSNVFSCLAIVISCLGLFGLAAFVSEQRTKEIGIRKVLGASVVGLWKMLSKDFILLVVISCLIAIPIAGYSLHDWLQQYAYRIEISWWIFVSASIGALMITLITVSFQAIKAATANPIDSLRSE